MYFGCMYFAKTSGSGDGDLVRCLRRGERDGEREREWRDRVDRRDLEGERERDRLRVCADLAL